MRWVCRMNLFFVLGKSLLFSQEVAAAKHPFATFVLSFFPLGVVFHHGITVFTLHTCGCCRQLPGWLWWNTSLFCIILSIRSHFNPFFSCTQTTEIDRSRASPTQPEGVLVSVQLCVCVCIFCAQSAWVCTCLVEMAVNVVFHSALGRYNTWERGVVYESANSQRPACKLTLGGKRGVGVREFVHTHINK